MQIQQKNDYSNTTISIPLSFTISKTSELQIQDSTKGDIVTPQEWIARELARIREDITPRHCPNHEGLLEVIDGMSKFLKQQVPQHQYQQATFDEIVTAKRDRVIAKELLILQQQQERRLNNSNNDNNNNNCNTCQQHNNSPIRGAPIEEMKFDDIANALVHIIQYSHRHILQNKNTSSNNSNTTSTQFNTPDTPDTQDTLTIPFSTNNNANNNDPHPVQLVRVFDDIRMLREQDGGRIKNPILAQQQLFSILFGHVQLTSQLFNPWQIICEWAKQLIYTKDWDKWMGFGLDAFIEAKNRCVTIDTLTHNSSLSPSNSSTASSSSRSSCGSDHPHQNHNGQLMMEQLQALLQSIHLVEKTFRA
ncbi:hypothetical protein BDC45DRAFT_516279 [Circinella umbellata]|nr:hypothetical protein BDC45DRAFT_516279 [Circinella umbellata]